MESRRERERWEGKSGLLRPTVAANQIELGYRTPKTCYFHCKSLGAGVAWYHCFLLGGQARRFISQDEEKAYEEATGW